MSDIQIDVSRIGTSSPTFSLYDFRETYFHIRKDFQVWEVMVEGKHEAGKIEKVAQDLLASHPMKLQFHAPMSDVNIGSVNERMRRASVREVVEAVRVASLLSADPMTIHPGHLSPLTRERPEILTKQMLRSLNEIDKAGIEYGVDLCLENMPNFPFAHCKSPKELLQAVEGTDLFFTLDIGHAHTNNNMAGFLYPEIVDRVKNVHVHDNLSDHDSHLTLGQGDIDLPRIILELEGLGYRGNYIIESRTLESSKSSKVYLTEIGDLLRC